MNVPWKITGKGVSRSGVIEATSEREAMEQVLRDPGFEPRDDESYSFSFGGLTGSTYGDEFDQMAGATSIDETELDMSSGYLHGPDPVLEQLEPEEGWDVDPRKVMEDMLRATGVPKELLDPDALKECDKGIDACKDRFNNIGRNFGGGLPRHVMPPPSSSVGEPDEWSLSSQVDSMPTLGHLGRRVVTDVRKEVEASFSGPVVQKVMDACMNNEEITIEQDFGPGQGRMRVTFRPDSYEQELPFAGQGLPTIRVSGIVTNDEMIP